MTPPEYIQLKAYARIDGALLSLLWVISFTFYIIGLSNQLASVFALGVAFSSPFFVAIRLKLFRDRVREGVISFVRCWAYSAFVFFYGSLLFSLAVLVYFTFIDQGYVLHMLQQMLQTADVVIMLKELDMEGTMSQMMRDFAAVRPIDIAINMMTSNVILGFFLSIPIALFMRSREQSSEKRKTE